MFRKTPICSRVRCFLLPLVAAVCGACASGTATTQTSPPEPEPQVSVAPAANAAETQPAQEGQPADEGEIAKVVPPPAEQFDSEDVAWIQQRLQDLGYYDGEVDGSPGKGTRLAIEEYQTDQGLEPDGRPTAEFREFMWRNGG